MAQHDQTIADQAGLSFLADLNAALAALFSNNSGATEPSVTVAYMWWPDTTSGWLKQRNAANDGWINVRKLDGSADDVAVGAGKGLIFEGATDDSFETTVTAEDPTADRSQTLPNMSGQIAVQARGADIASASTINLTTATGDIVDVTGTTAITAITLADGLSRKVRFTGALTLTNGASLILPGGANITTAAGDVAEFRGYSGGVVRCTGFARANGQAVVGSAGAGTLQAWVNFNGTGTVAIRASGNVSSITDNATGDYTVNFSTSISDANYFVAACAVQNTMTGPTDAASMTTTSVRIVARNDGGTASDRDFVGVAIFR